jgi:hypothetical protein
VERLYNLINKKCNEVIGGVGGVVPQLSGPRLYRTSKKIKVFNETIFDKEGNITSSPGSMFNRMAAISKASVQDVVSKHFLKPKRSSKKAWHFLVNMPSPDILPLCTAW